MSDLGTQGEVLTLGCGVQGDHRGTGNQGKAGSIAGFAPDWQGKAIVGRANRPAKRPNEVKVHEQTRFALLAATPPDAPSRRCCSAGRGTASG